MMGKEKWREKQAEREKKLEVKSKK